MKKGLGNKIYIAVFMLILVLPTVCMNFKPHQKSEIDNKVLTEFPDFTKSPTETMQQLSDYAADRVGFREDAITLYTLACDKVFGVMIHPLFMYGKEGHVYYKDKDYIAAYQKLNTDEEFMDDFNDFLCQTSDYLKEKDIKFLYFLCPDKKTIYPEYFPDTVHVKDDNTSVIDYMKSKLIEDDFEYIIPDDVLREKKEEFREQNLLIYNKKYDATHWNEFGSFISHSVLDEHIQKWFSDVSPLDIGDFSLEMVKMDHLDQSNFPIDDDVPVYTLLNDTSEDATSYLEGNLKCNTTTFYSHYMNNAVENNRILLVFTDSYFATYHKYYNNRFKEVYFVHRQNYDTVQYFVNLLFPDAVIFETAERCISSEMPLLADFKDYYYESPYKETDIESNEIIPYTITSAEGVRVEGNKIYINPEEGESIVSISGILNDYERTKDLNIYFEIQGNVLETDNCALHRIADENELKQFEINVQRRYITPGEVRLFAVDENTGTKCEIETFEVEYGK